MTRWLTVALLGVTLATGALLIGTTAQLPDRVATHFDWSGNPNGWMNRDSYLLFMLGFGIALPWLVYGFGRLHRSMRNQDYWLAPPRREATLGAVRAYAASTAIATALFVTSMHFAILSAHAVQPVRLDNRTLMIAVLLFAAALIGLAIAHALRFARTRERTLQR